MSRDLIVGVGIVIVGWLAVWISAALATRLLRPGVARTALTVLPSILTLFQRLLRSKLVPLRARAVLLIGFLYAISPITIIPDFIPVIGKLDNVLALAGALRLSSRWIPVEVLREAWTGPPSILAVLAGSRVLVAPASRAGASEGNVS
jgi:uncharacterized membrane protein YkvA (DUF1232 family)